MSVGLTSDVKVFIVADDPICSERLFPEEK